MRRIFLAIFLLALAGCGPNMKLVRQYMANSPHRKVAILPFDLAPKQKNLSQQAADVMENKMRRLGFVIADHQKTRDLYAHSKIKNQTFNTPEGAADLGRQLGVQAVLIGIIDQAYERAQRTPAQYEIVTNPMPACCNRPVNPCAGSLVYDPMVQAYVNSCSGPTHRKVQMSPATSARFAGFAVRLRLVDTQSSAVFWESAQSVQPDGATAYTAADQATDLLSDRLIEDFMKQGL